MTTSGKKQIWKNGGCFAVPLHNRRFLAGQILAAEPVALNSVSRSLFDQRLGSQEVAEPILDRLFSLLMTTRDQQDVKPANLRFKSG